MEERFSVEINEHLFHAFMQCQPMMQASSTMSYFSCQENNYSNLISLTFSFLRCGNTNTTTSSKSSNHSSKRKLDHWRNDVRKLRLETFSFHSVEVNCSPDGLPNFSFDSYIATSDCQYCKPPRLFRVR